MQPLREFVEGDRAAYGDAPLPAAVGGDEAAACAPGVVEPGDGFSALDEEGAALYGFLHGGDGGAQGFAALESDGFAVVAEDAGYGEGPGGKSVASPALVDDESQGGGVFVGSEVAAVDAGVAAVPSQGFAQIAVAFRGAFVNDDEACCGGVKKDGFDACFAAQQGGQPRARRGAREAFVGLDGCAAEGDECDECQEGECVSREGMGRCH